MRACGYQTFSFLQSKLYFILTFPFFWLKNQTFFNICFEPRPWKCMTCCCLHFCVCLNSVFVLMMTIMPKYIDDSWSLLVNVFDYNTEACANMNIWYMNCLATQNFSALPEDLIWQLKDNISNFYSISRYS